MKSNLKVVHMPDIALQNYMRRLWMAMKFFQVPITHPYIQNLTEFDLEFMEWSIVFDNPKGVESYLNKVYDDEFDDFWKNPNAADLKQYDTRTEEEREKSRAEVLRIAKERMDENKVRNLSPNAQNASNAKIERSEHDSDFDDFANIGDAEEMQSNFDSSWEEVT